MHFHIEKREDEEEGKVKEFILWGPKYGTYLQLLNQMECEHNSLVTLGKMLRSLITLDYGTYSFLMFTRRGKMQQAKSTKGAIKTFSII